MNNPILVVDHRPTSQSVKERPPSFKVFALVLFFILIGGAPHSALAQDLELWGWDITGFGTIGYAESGKYDDLVLKRNITQRSQKIEDSGWLVDSRLGIQARKEFDANWDALGQIVAKEQADNSIENSLQMAFLRYRSTEGDWSFQLGRMILDTFQLSDYRNVGYSYHWVRPPAEFYGWIPFSNYDGLKAVYEIGDFDSLVRLEAFVGKSKSTVNIGYGSNSTSMNYVKSLPAIGGGITWEKDDLTLRAYISRYRFTQNTAAYQFLVDTGESLSFAWAEGADIANDYAIENKKITYGALGAKWTPGAWHFQSEVSYVDAEAFGTYDGERAYFQVGHRLGEFIPHITFSRSWDTRNYPYGSPSVPTGFGAVVDGGVTALDNTFIDSIYSGTVNQYTWSLGVRWDFASQKALKVQCDRSTLHENSLGVFATQNTTEGSIRDFDKSTRTWCSATFDWVF